MNLLFLTHANLSKIPYGDGSTRYRCFNVAEIALDRGHTAQVITVDQLNFSQLPSFDLISWLRPQADMRSRAVIKRAKQLNIPCVADIDDLIFVPELAKESPAVVNGFISEKKVAQRFAGHASMLKQFDAVTLSTDTLQKHVKNQFLMMPSAHIANGLSQYWLRRADQSSIVQTYSKSSVRSVGYLSGSRSHDQDFMSICKPISNWLNSNRCHRIDIVGKLEYPEKVLPIQRVHKIPWVDYFQLPNIIKAQCATLAPLTNTRFNTAKSHIKFLESAALGVPIISSSIPDFLQHQCSGILIADTLEQWRDALETVSDADFYHDVSDALQNYTRNHCTAKQYAQPLIESWESGNLLPNSTSDIEYENAA